MKLTGCDFGPRVGVMSAQAETKKVCGKLEGKRATGEPHRVSAAPALPHPAAVCRQETHKSRFARESTMEKPIDVSSRAEEQAPSTAAPSEQLKARATGLALAGGVTHAAPAAEPPPTCETNEEEEHTEEEEEVDGKVIKAPLELVIEFLGAVMDRDVQLASRLCQMILIHEPDNPEACQFLPLIQEKLLEEQEMGRSTEEDEDGDSGSDEASLSGSSSSSSAEEEEA